jgi:hypothetical protein
LSQSLVASTLKPEAGDPSVAASEEALQVEVPLEQCECRGVEDYWYQVPRQQPGKLTMLAERAEDGDGYHLHQFESTEDAARFLAKVYENGLPSSEVLVISRVTRHPASVSAEESSFSGTALPTQNDPDSRQLEPVYGELPGHDALGARPDAPCVPDGPAITSDLPHSMASAASV